MPNNCCSSRELGIAGIVLGSVFGMTVLCAVLPAVYPESGLGGLFSHACHQRPERSHLIDGTPLAVCVRCFWLYAGLFAGSVRFVFLKTVPKWRTGMLTAAIAFSSADWLAGWAGILQHDVWLRALSGFVLGIAISHFSVPGIAELLSGKTSSTSTLQINHEFKRT